MKKMMLMAMACVLLVCACTGALALEYDDTITVWGQEMNVAHALSFRQYLILDMYDREAEEIMLALNEACGDAAMNKLAITGKWDERVYWLERAAQEGNGFAMYLLWQEYWDVDNEKAIAYLKQAAEHGIYHAHYELAMGYCSGEIGNRWDKVGFETDREKGFQLLTLAAEAGVTEAMYHLGRAYEYGSVELPMDKQKAAAWYMQTRERGTCMAMEHLYAIENLAYMYEAGDDIEPNDELMFQLFHEAKDHPMNHYCLYSIWDAKLIKMYAEGRGTRQDIAKAWEMLHELREDCEGYDIDWTYAMGLMYEKGYGVEKDLELAERYYAEARQLEYEWLAIE